ncbi:MAG: PAS domain S-box protein [Terracidiphilus sp.]|jgi:diguanylate cyclase (GGDEF)-like protein/PAS domain S-box-containing protein
MPSHAESNLSALIESTKDPIWSVDLNFRLTAFNQALSQHFQDTFGVTPEIGMRTEDFAPPERAGLMPPFYQRALAEGSFRVEFPLADGRTLELAFNAIVIDGKATGVSVFAKDITARMIAEDALREAERKYRTIFDGALEGFYQTTLDGKPLSANPALARMLGYESPDELLSLVKDSSRDAWVDADERARFVRRLEEQQTIRNYECQFKRKDGTPLWVSLNCRRVCGTDGGGLYLEGFIEDIAARKQVEELLQQTSEHVRLFIEHAPVSLAMFDRDMCYLFASRRWLTDFGLGDRDLRGHSQYEVFPEIPERWKNAHRLGLAGEVQSEEEDYFVRMDGTVHWLRWILRPWHDTEGRVGGIVIFTEDITPRKLSELRMRESEELYRTTFEQAAVGIVHTTFDGHFLRCNSRFAEIVGYPLDEIAGLTLQQITVPEDLASCMDILHRMSESQSQNSSWEKRYVRKDGSLTWVEITVSTLRDDQGNALHSIALVEDINARKAAEQSLAEAAEALRVSEERYRTIFQTSVDGIAISQTSDGKYIDANKVFLDLMGFERQEIIGKTSLELTLWVDLEARNTMLATLNEHSGFRDLETQFARKNGTIIWVLISASAIEIHGVPCILSVVRDITAARADQERLAEATEALRSSEERYRVAFQTNLDSITINRLGDGIYVDVNQAFLDTIGSDRDQVIGRSSLELGIWADPRDRQTMVEMVRQNSCCRGIEVQFRKRNGELFWGQMSASPMEIDGVPCILSITRDISPAKAAENEIRTLAFYDPLTGLPNRRLLLERLRLPVTAGGRVSRSRALLVVDLDDFKTLNDTLGHQTGDLLLQEVASRIAACADEADAVCRLGGDEFVVMLENLSEVAEEAAAQAKATGEKILALISSPYMIEGRECLSTASIGITIFDDRQKTADEILQQTDIALHQAKAAGRATMRFFSPALQAAVNARAALEEDLRLAIKTKQFLLYYQPQVERGRLTGAEALIRWQHPVRGIIMPDKFIPISEESRLILPLGDWVLEAVCAQIALWASQKQTAYLSVAVNISALQFRQPEFVQHVLAAIESTGANPQNLKLELTESMLVENIEEVIAKMTELKSHGLSFSLDDFGTGYSSLAYLKRLPLDQLKIDRAFVRDMLVDATSGAIAQTIISLGRAMGLSVIAEGVETEEQRGFLSGLGCHSFQGFLFSRPLPLDEFQGFFKRFAESPAPRGN